MRPVSYTLIESVSAPVVEVFALLTDPGRIAKWLPGCDAVESGGPLKKGARFKARFGQRETEFEIVDFAPPATLGWVEHRWPRTSVSLSKCWPRRSANRMERRLARSIRLIARCH